MTSGVPQGILGPVLLNSFINDMDRTEGTLSRAADDTKLSGMVTHPKDGMPARGTCTSSRCGHLGTPLRFNKTKCKVPHLGHGNPQYEHRLGDEQMGSSPAQKHLGVLVDEQG